MDDDVKYHLDYGFPLMNLPLPGYDVSDEDLSNTIKPLLQGCEALLTALVEAIPKSTISKEAASHALALVAGQLDLAVHAFTRWEQRPAKREKGPGHAS